MSSQKDLSLNEKNNILNRIKEKPVNTPVCELEKCLSVAEAIIARFKT